MSRFFAAAALSLAGFVPAAAQNFPVKTVRIVVPLSPGGNVDITARAIAPEMGQALGQQVIVDNRPGASGQIGAELVAKSPADGYTLMVASSSLMTNVPALYPKLSFDMQKDFSPVGPISEVPLVIVVHPSVPARTTKQFIAVARARPGELRMASGGVGTTSHLVAELFNVTANIKMLIVPYKGAGPALIDLLGGHIDSRIDQIPSSVPHIKSQKLRAIAVTSLRRTALMPELPTIAESALPGFEASTITGLLAPAGTPAAVMQRLHGALGKALANPVVVERFTSLAADVRPGTGDELAKYIREDTARWKKIVQQLGIKPE